MKRHAFISLAAAMTLFAGCSNDNEPETKPSGNGESSVSYLAVTIAPNFPDSRADNSDEANADGNNYEAGTSDENAITSVRFYFFNSDGSMALVKKTPEGDMVNFYDLTEIPGTNDNNTEGMPNVERGLNAVLVINTAEGDQRPAKILAVCNRSNALTDTPMDLDAVRRTSSDYASYAEDNQFVMSSSVYVGSNGTGKVEISATSIPEECYQDQPAAAMLNPVVIYVERVVAKVSVKLDAKELDTKTITENDKEYTLVPLKDAEGNNTLIDGNQVYAKFLDWNVTAATERSSLSKHINPAWDVFPAWNYAPYFRSYWALNCAGAGTRYMPFTKAGDSSDAISTGKHLTTEFSSLYTNENAAAHANATNGEGRAYPSTVIMSAQLCDANGTPVTAYRWFGQVHAGLDNLKTSMLAQIANSNNMIYCKEGETPDGGFTAKSLTAEDLQFITAYQAKHATLNESTTGRYNSYVVLSEAGAAKTWYTTEDCTEGSEMTTTAVNSFLDSTLGAAEIWNEGHTYYYFPIKHYGTMTADGVNMGQYGVVRNHAYKSNVSKIVGLGTPVYDPTETIYPEKPDNSNTYVAARIQILSWRVVTNNIELDWGE